MNKKSILPIIVTALMIPILFFEYFALLWFWGGDGSFAFFLTPVVFATYVLLQIWLKKKCQKELFKRLIHLSIAVVTPIVTVLTVYFFAWVFNIDIMIA